jgi:hypothetical protein
MSQGHELYLLKNFLLAIRRYSILGSLPLVFDPAGDFPHNRSILSPTD